MSKLTKSTSKKEDTSKILEEKLLNIFNRNVPLTKIYKADEIKEAFLKESYDSGTHREQELYIIFFTECTNNEDIEDLKKFCNTTSTKIKRIYNSFSIERKNEFGNFWIKRFRLPKIDIEISSRDDIIYKEIDNFKSYELTPCIAYEMAIRNKEVKSLLKRYKKIIEMSNHPRYLYHRIFNETNFKDAENHLGIPFLPEYKGLTFEEYSELVFRKIRTYEILIEEDYKKFIDEDIDKCTELGLSELNLLKEKLENELTNDYLIYTKPFYLKYSEKYTNFQKDSIPLEYDNPEIESKYIPINKDVDIGYKFSSREIIHKEFIHYQKVYYGSDKFYKNYIISNFKRQMNEQNQVNLSINFSLPIEEIKEYIEIIKKKINPKTPYELLGYKLEKANNSSNMNAFDYNNKEVTFDATKGDKPQSKIADMLFIYDMKIKGFTNTDIIYASKKDYTDKTIKKYFVIAKEYIDNLKYKELITGKVEKKQ